MTGPNGDNATPAPGRGRTYTRPPLTSRQRRIRIVVAAIAVVLLVGVPLFGYYAVFLRPANQVIVQVNDVTYTRADLLVRLRVKLYEAADIGGSPVVNPLISVREVLDEELATQAAGEVGASVSPDDVDRRIWQSVMNEPRPDSPTDRLQREFDERYQQYLLVRDVSEGFHRDIVRAGILQDLLRADFLEQVPTTVPHIHLAWMAVDDRTAAEAIGQRVAAGERFADIVATSDSPITGIEWRPTSLLDSLTKDAIASLKPGEVSRPAPNPNGGLVLYGVLDPVETRQVSSLNIGALGAAAFEEWVKDQELRQNVVYQLDGETYDWLVDQLRQSRPVGGSTDE